MTERIERNGIPIDVDTDERRTMTDESAFIVRAWVESDEYDFGVPMRTETLDFETATKVRDFLYGMQGESEHIDPSSIRICRPDLEREVNRSE